MTGRANKTVQDKVFKVKVALDAPTSSSTECAAVVWSEIVFDGSLRPARFCALAKML